MCQGGAFRLHLVLAHCQWPGRRAIHLLTYSNTDSIITNGVRTNDLSKLEVRLLRNLIAPVSETNRVVFLRTVSSSKLSDDHSKGPVMREHFVLPVLEELEGYRQKPCQGLHSV